MIELIDWNEWAEKVHQNARAHGFWDGDLDCYAPDGALRPAVLLSKIALMHSEVSEAYNDWLAGLCFISKHGDKPNGCAIELADCAIRILDTAGGLSLPLSCIHEELRQASIERLFGLLRCRLDAATEIARLPDFVEHRGELSARFVEALHICVALCWATTRTHLADAMQMKHEFNITRPHMHGNKTA